MGVFTEEINTVKNMSWKDTIHQIILCGTVISNALIMWDSCKFLHRTQPYTLTKPKQRVLVSVNLSTDVAWAVKTINTCLKYQGNQLWIE